MEGRKKRVFKVWTIAAVAVALVFALPWTPLWRPILAVSYFPVLCLLNVDHWFSASGTLTLSNGTGADLSDPDDPARRAEVDRIVWLCHTYSCSVDFMLWPDDPGSGPTVRVRAKAWSPDRARGLVDNVIAKYNAGEGPSSAREISAAKGGRKRAERYRKRGRKSGQDGGRGAEGAGTGLKSSREGAEKKHKRTWRREKKSEKKRVRGNGRRKHGCSYRIQVRCSL